MRVTILVFAPVLAILAAPASAQSAGCASSIRAEADAESFTTGGRAGDTAALVSGASTNFAAAAQRLCVAGTVRPADLASFTTLVVRNAEGTAEPVVYDDPEQGEGKIILEYAFVGAAPSEAALGTAIRCWRRPESAGCDQGGD